VSEDSIDKLLRKVPATRRQVIKRLLMGAFVVPVVSSFPLDRSSALYLSSAGASNGTFVIVPNSTIRN